MSVEPTMPSTSDLRSSAQPYKRDATRKHKWALGATETVTREGQKPRPTNPSETVWNCHRRYQKGCVAALETRTKLARRQDVLESTAISSSDESAASDLDDATAVPADAGVMYSFDAVSAPSHGSQILHSALNKAVQKFEDIQTTKLVKDEYEVLGVDGESLGLMPARKGRKAAGPTAATAPDAEEDYEFV